MDKTIENIHPNAPKRLVSLWRKVRSDRQIAELRGVNHFYVSQLLWRGIEPGKAEIRVKLFLSAKPLKRRDPKPEEWSGQKRVMKKVRQLHRETTRTFKRGMSPNGKHEEVNDI